MLGTALNYSLSKATRIVENASGRLKARFRFIMKGMECKLETSVLAIKACCILIYAKTSGMAWTHYGKRQ